MDFQLIRSTGEALNQYYDDEKNSLPIVISAAVFMLAIGVALLKQNHSFSRGMGTAIMTVSLLLAVWAIVYAFQVGPQRAIYEGLLRNDPPNYCSKEMAHLNKMQENFRKIIGTNLIISMLGLGLLLLGASQKHEFMKGTGIGLAGMFLLLSLMENRNRKRVLLYKERVEVLQKYLSFEA